MARYLVEFIGTFFLVFTIGMTVIAPGAGVLAPFAIGAALMMAIYAGGHISGAHYNPAITLAIWMRGQFAASDMPGYLAAQVVAAFAAALLVGMIKGPAAMAAVITITPPATPALVAEFLFTFALAWVILNVATAPGTSGNSYYGLAISATVVAGVFAVGNVSGAAFNPAVAMSLVVMGLLPPGALWIFLVANIAGAALAALTFRATMPQD